MFPTLLLLLTATPVSLELDLSSATKARVGVRVRELLVQRLEEEGFTLQPGARVKLRVEELHGTLQLSASVGERSTASELRPSGTEWRDELALELAQRLTILAHEAAAFPEATPPPRATPAPELEPELPAREPRAATPPPDARGDEPLPQPERFRLRVGAGLRAGIAVRPPSVDPSLALFGFVRTDGLQPLLLVGLTIARAPALTVFEVPLGLGVRLPIALGADFSLVPELAGGVRLHAFGASATDGGGVALDVFGSLALALLCAVGPFKLGLRLSADVGTAQEHLLGTEVLWSRGPFEFGAQLHLER